LRDPARPRERRRLGRPQNGDVKPCPQCANGSIEFSDRYRFEGAVVAAWVCDGPHCRYREVVRRTVPPPDPIAESREVQAHAKRTMMKSRDKQKRSAARIAKSEQRIRRVPKS
jgi:hypothetical protein